MNNLISTYLARVLAAWVAGFAAWLLTKYGVQLGFEDQAALVTHLVGIILPTFMMVYAVAHRLISKHTNPGDAASSHLASLEAVKAAQLKAADQ